MKIDPDVRAIAKDASNSQVFAALLQAVVTAEGNILRAVQCSIQSVQTREKALDVACRSLTHALCDFARQTAPAAFVAQFAAKWAPVNVANDPDHLNENLPRNVLRLWTGVTA